MCPYSVMKPQLTHCRDVSASSKMNAMADAARMHIVQHTDIGRYNHLRAYTLLFLPPIYHLAYFISISPYILLQNIDGVILGHQWRRSERICSFTIARPNDHGLAVLNN
jgi:hypothetical protein